MANEAFLYEPDEMKSHDDEITRIRQSYARRSATTNAEFSNLIRQEREPHYLRFLQSDGMPPLESIRLLEVGCGTGSELQRLFAMGLNPALCAGVELLEDRHEIAHRELPDECTIVLGDASATSFDSESFDVVFASTVFTSILDDAVQEALALEMWRLTRPGGAILWYDFVMNNPSNPDVRGVPRQRVESLFPEGSCIFKRTTLAPPIGRRIARFGATAYRTINMFPFLRTHLVGWITKPD